MGLRADLSSKNASINHASFCVPRWELTLWFVMYKYRLCKEAQFAFNKKQVWSNSRNSFRFLLYSWCWLYTKIGMHILQNVLFTIPEVLTRRICITKNIIMSFFSWWSFHLISWPECLSQGWWFREELHASHSEGLQSQVVLTNPISATECTSRSTRNDSLVKSKSSVITSSLVIDHIYSRFFFHD